ncbi:MAG: hypothetical protein HY815_09950 [Candidatus Riflebacteria bacterium]|nr:hypothetical protein [Candidatus Riflebacteria bacterium]
MADLELDGHRWKPAGRWWGRGHDGRSLEIDVVAEPASSSGPILVGEVKLSLHATELPRMISQLQSKVEQCPLTRGRPSQLAFWLPRPLPGGCTVPLITASDVFRPTA